MRESGNGIFTIDGVDLRVNVVDLERGFSVTDTEHSGRMQNDEMHRDIIGTYYSYTLSVEPVSAYRGDYDTFYGIVSAPVAFHQMVFPFGQETLEFQAYITSGKDKMQSRPTKSGYINLWSGLSIQFTAKEPQRRP